MSAFEQGDPSHLEAVANIFKIDPRAEIVGEMSLGEGALSLAVVGWKVFPLAERTKVPYFGSSGLNEATVDFEQIVEWWRFRKNSNIGLALPPEVIVIDIDNRHGGHINLATLEAAHEPLTPTLKVKSGGGGGYHHYYQHPGHKVTAKRLPEGVELRYHGNYLVVPPSIVNSAYEWANDLEIAPLPEWFSTLIKVTPVITRPVPLRKRSSHPLKQINRKSWEWFNENRSWHDVLSPKGWTVVAGDGESDSSAWRHPTATSKVSATIRYALLFSYSPNTGLEVSGAGDPHGYTKFHAWYELNGMTGSQAAKVAYTMMKDAA